MALLLALFTWALSSPRLVGFVETAEQTAAANEPKSPEEPTDGPAAVNKHETNGEANEESAAAVNEPGATKRVSPGVGPEATMFLNFLLARLF